MKKLVLIALVAAAASCTGAETTTPTAAGNQALVINVPDGDSLIVEMDGTEEKVRLIGVNAPEHDECFGKESASGLRELVGDAQITIVTDVETRDQYGRLLGYVYLDGTLVNEEIVFRGLSLARAYEPNTAFQEQIDAAGRDAQQNQRGLWAPTGCASTSGAGLAITNVEPNPPGPDEDNLNGEWVVISNTSSIPVDLTDWTLRDASSVHRYAFASGTILAGGADIFVYTGCGADDDNQQFWCAKGPVWGNSGDSAFLLDAEGRIAAFFDY